MLDVPTDVTDESQCKVMVGKTVAVFGRLVILINNAGLYVTLVQDRLPMQHKPIDTLQMIT